MCMSRTLLLVQLLDVEDDNAVCCVDHAFHDQRAATATIKKLLQSPEKLCKRDTCISLALGPSVDSNVRTPSYIPVSDGYI